MREVRNEDLLLGAGAVALGAAGLLYFAPRQRILRTARKELGNREWTKYLQGVVLEPLDRPIAWCGVFVLWVLHKAGIAKKIPWVLGKGILYMLPKTTDPKPGDIAYFDKPYQHHAIVEKVTKDFVRTIDGNSADQVQRNVRPRGEVSAFYSIKPWI